MQQENGTFGPGTSLMGQLVGWDQNKERLEGSNV